MITVRRHANNFISIQMGCVKNHEQSSALILQTKEVKNIIQINCDILDGASVFVNN